MAGEFTKRVVDNKNIWTCNLCSVDIVSQSKPRNHVCRDPEDESQTTEQPSTSTPKRGSSSVPNSPFNPQYRPDFSAPPPRFNAPPAGMQNQQTNMDALLRFQMFQADQNKQMLFLQQQNKEMHTMQQEQTDQKMNQMMEILKIQKQSETKVKCPRWEKEENVKNFLNRLKRWNSVENGKGKYLQLLNPYLILEEKVKNRE